MSSSCVGRSASPAALSATTAEKSRNLPPSMAGAGPHGLLGGPALRPGPLQTGSALAFPPARWKLGSALNRQKLPRDWDLGWA